MGVKLSSNLVSTTENPPGIPPPAVDAPARIDETGVELKRGAFVNTIAMLASNFRGVFTFLVAATPWTGCPWHVSGCVGGD
jgi:hypothetical protein